MRNNLFSLLIIVGALNAEEDIQNLTEALKHDPQNATKLYQLAEANMAANNWTQAISWYHLRLDQKGDKEEIWASKYGLGKCYEKTGQWSNALYWYLEAFQDSNNRPDPLLNIAIHYRLNGENDLAYIFSKHGSRILPYHDYKFEEELSIVSYYTRFKEDGYKAASDLIIRKGVPWHAKEQAYKNILFYTQNLKNARFKPIVIDLPLIQEGADERYHPMNPSIHKTEIGYEVICRTVNYTQKGAIEFNTIDPDGYIRTRNFLVLYDTNFNFLSQHEIVEDLLRERTPSKVLGLEDCRIFPYMNDRWFSCSTRDTNKSATTQITLCKLANEIQDDIRVEKLLPLHGPDPYRCEKNWLPFIVNNSLNIIYSYDPFTIYKPDLETGECEIELCYEPTHDFSQFKGSAPPIAFDNGYLLLVHETVHFPDNSRVYLHRLLYLDHHFYVKQTSKPFTFIHQGIEFCCSMTLNHSESELIFALGIEDEKAHLCFVDLKTIRSLLTPLQNNL